MNSAKTHPFFSVIIPTYNRSRYINKAIDSVLNQTYTDYEIIVVDDGSSDNTRNVLASYHSKIKCFFQENKGVSAARNSGIRLSKGKWLAFLDSDDEWMKSYLETQFEQIRMYPNAIIHVTNSIERNRQNTDTNTFDRKGILNTFPGKQSHYFMNPLTFVIQYHITNLQCTIIDKTAAIDVGFFKEHMHIAEDTDYIIRVCLRGPLSIWIEPLVILYRREEIIANLSAAGIDINRANLIRSVEDILTTETLTLDDKQYLSTILSNHYRALGNYCFLNGDNDRARTNFKMALIWNKSLWNFLKYLSSYAPKVVVNFTITRSISFNK